MSDKYSQYGPVFDIANIFDEGVKYDLLHVGNREEYELLSGHLYTAGYFFDTVAENAEVYLLIQVGSKPALITYTVDALSAGKYGITQNIVGPTGGVVLTALNRNQLAVFDNTLQVIQGATVTDIGQPILPRLHPGTYGGTPASSQGGAPGSALKSALFAPGTLVAVWYKNIGSLSTPVSMIVDWTEVHD